MVPQYINPVRNSYTPKLDDRKWLEPKKRRLVNWSMFRWWRPMSFDIVMAQVAQCRFSLESFTLGVSQYHDSSEKMWRSIPKLKNEKKIELFLHLGYPKAIPILSYIHPIPILWIRRNNKLQRLLGFKREISNETKKKSRKKQKKRHTSWTERQVAQI